ncbi:MAG: MBL fold metallo-hydrolase [Candidatus Tectomicrobia bacterium]|uniref:MBL fold metallo-hydrolase n=1 Tax=Tectimicrobiota bacterium TaxID=2528274 RepID=A0A932FVX6_UNCTE|nr:MBL fold metallo-hydrolase [Candidatus Tectomicrobia bacterium]
MNKREQKLRGAAGRGPLDRRPVSPGRRGWSGNGSSFIRCKEQVYLIDEPGQVASFLVVGQERAALIDTGLGIGNIRRVVERVCPAQAREILVINTHAHFDHIGGNHQFSGIAIHREEGPLLGQEVPRDLLQRFVKGSAFWGPFPQGFDPQGYRILPSQASHLLEDGEYIDLGGRGLRVLHTPGHSPGGICLFEEEKGILFSGDTVYQGVLFANIEGADVAAYRESARLLASLASRVRVIYPGHCQFILDSAILRELDQAFRQLEAGTIPLNPTLDFLGQPALEAWFGNFSLLLPLDRS